MILEIFSIEFLSCLLLLYATVPSWAVEAETKPEQRSFTLEVTNNFIDLQADQVKKILNKQKS